MAGEFDGLSVRQRHRLSGPEILAGLIAVKTKFRKTQVEWVCRGSIAADIDHGDGKRATAERPSPDLKAASERTPLERAGMKQTIVGRRPEDGRSIEVIVEDGLVQAIRERGRDDEDVWLAPGLIDLQVNGYGGDDVNLDIPDPEVIISLTRKMLAIGVTTYLPTIITASEAKMIAALRAVAEARRRSRLVADMVPYVHVEGPSISSADGPRGAHPLEHVRPPDPNEFKRWQATSQGLVGMVTLSPHFENAAEYIAALSGQGVYVAIGHTDATSEQIHRAIDAGATLSTHLGNGSAALIPRHTNVLWPQLADDRLMATLIADGNHLPNDLLKTVLRAKGIARSILVSDSVALAGMPPGRYETPVGGTVELNDRGRLSLAGTEFLAGAALPLKDGVARAISCAGISLSESLRMATENPGRFVGGLGVLRVGAPADLVRFTVERDPATLRIETVMIKGREWPNE
jgi:N-acetylglucosamine-6-phosphate deacetylase